MGGLLQPLKSKGEFLSAGEEFCGYKIIFLHQESWLDWRDTLAITYNIAKMLVVTGVQSKMLR